MKQTTICLSCVFRVSVKKIGHRLCMIQRVKCKRMGLKHNLCSFRAFLPDSRAGFSQFHDINNFRISCGKNICGIFLPANFAHKSIFGYFSPNLCQN